MMALTRVTGADDQEPAPLHTLTTKQRKLLEAIDRYEQGTGEPCTAGWLARHTNTHHTTIREHLQALHRRGWLATANAPVRLRHPLRGQ